MRIATWNLKQAVAPKKALDHLWAWAETEIAPDVIAFTEAKVPTSGVPSGWSAHWEPEGIGPRRRWGTVMAGRGVELRPVTDVRRRWRTVSLQWQWPAVVNPVDVVVGGERWATVVGFYALTVDDAGVSCGHGRHSMPLLMRQLELLLDSDRGQRLIVAGDMNLWPSEVTPFFARYGLVDVVDHTADQRGRLPGCASCRPGDRCGHMWTHRNGNSPNAAVQQIDYILCSGGLVNELTTVRGGAADFPDSWDVSDHAPVVAEFGAEQPRVA